ALGGLVMGEGGAAVAGAGVSSTGTAESSDLPLGELAGMLGMGMVFVLLTYGGWDEAAYLSGEIRDVGRNMLRVLLYGTAVIVALYVLVNMAYLQVFGLEGLRNTQAVGADMTRLLAGPWAAVCLSVLVCCTALSKIGRASCR